MSQGFHSDPHPGRPKVLFVGQGESSHTHAWVDLLAGSALNVRLFSLPWGNPPSSWGFRAYETHSGGKAGDRALRRRFYSTRRLPRMAQRAVARFAYGGTALEEKWLAGVVRRWRPDVIHTLGLESAGEFYLRARERYNLAGIGKWVLQLRGGSDLALTHRDPGRAPELARVMKSADQIVTDNFRNFEIGDALGVPREKWAPIAPVPGTGGLDVDRLAAAAERYGPPSRRRVILYPKAYECPWSKCLPVYEALKLCWERLTPCRIHLLAFGTDQPTESINWFRSLPQGLRDCCVPEARIPRERVFDLMAQARVMLAVSLVDGTPNSLFEAMACGAAPVVSPLDTITPIVEPGRNVLFARNLYPHEIADALVRAMTDDALVDRMAAENLTRVRELADRGRIAPKVIAYYEQLAARAG